MADISDQVDRRAPFAALLDAGFIALFVAIGRRNHDEEATVTGYLGTLWPFLVALLLGWTALRAWRTPTTVRTGVTLWPIVVVVGMLLRRLAGDGTALAFVIVATVFLGLTLVGWRAIWSFAEARRRQSASA
jgi:FtsH-binding integral membrane protein